MMTPRIVAAAIAAVTLAAPAFADPSDAAGAKETSIPFADHDGISDWNVVDSHTIFIKGATGKWYRATMFGSCFNLTTGKIALGFEPNAGGDFDKFSAIRAGGQRCPLRSLIAVAPPPKKAKKRKS